MKRSPPKAAARRKVCVLLPAHWTAGMGGSEYQAKLLVEHLLEHYDVEVVYLTTAAAGQAPDGYEVVRFSDRTGLRKYGTFFDVIRLYRALCRLAPDVIYQQVGCAHTGIAAWYARLHGRQMVWRVSSDRHTRRASLTWWRVHERLERFMLEQGIRRADLVLAQTEAQRRNLASAYERANVAVVPNFHPPVTERASSVRPLRKRVVWIANVKRLKRPLKFVRLAERFRDRTDVEFVAAGAVQEADVGAELQAAIEPLPNFRFLGACTQAECEALLDGAVALVNTSDFEGFPNTFIQAWLRGVPVVSLSVDPDGTLSRGGLGFVARTEERLAAQVERLLDDRALAERIGTRCRAHAERHHSMRNADRVAALLGLRRKGAEPARAVDTAAPAATPLRVGEG